MKCKDINTYKPNKAYKPFCSCIYNLLLTLLNIFFKLIKLK